MSNAKSLVFSVVIIVLCSGARLGKLAANDPAVVPAVQTNDVDGKDETQQQARRLWEQAIAAKGGRERLYAIQSMSISQRAYYKRQTFTLPVKYETLLSKNEVRTVSLDVFPNKFWNCEDYRPDVFGVIMHMYNYESGMKYVLTLGDPVHPLEPIERNETRESRTYGLVAYLLETTWLKPTPVTASIGNIGRQQVDIVQTILTGKRIDFAFDRETHLPVQVSYYSVSNGQTFVTTVALSDYVEVKGIKVAQIVQMDEGTKYRQTVQFDVEYDPDIFTKLPNFEAGLNAWRPKTKR